ncbi:MAG: response regulator [Bdellovibrionales bacterium]|nr:response regulator [Bdellovibrionales bacterium]
MTQSAKNTPIPGKILVVEDEPELLEIVVDTLRFEGLDVLGASNGAEALEIMRTQVITLVVTDLNMPIVSGIKLRQNSNELSADHRPQHWMALTGQVPDTQPRDGLQLFDQSFYKPYNPTMLAIYCKKKLLELSGSGT